MIACMTRTRGRTLEDLFAAACTAISRLSPAEAFAAAMDGAQIIDIRSFDARRRDGIVPGALHIPRTVLEWRVAPESGVRNGHVGGVDRRLVLICDHGYASALAAATLVELGFRDAGDVTGGFAAWRAAGLPVGEAPPPGDGLPGSGPPDPA